MKVLHSICQQIWKTQQWPQDWQRSVFIPILRKSNARECSNYHTIVLISHCSKVVLKILQARHQQYMNWELPDVQLDLEKARDQRSNCQHPLDYRKSNRILEKNIYFCSIDYTKAFDCGPQKTGKFLKRWKYQTTLAAFWEICIQVAMKWSHSVASDSLRPHGL